MLWSNFYRCNPNSYAIVVRMGTLLSTVGQPPIHAGLKLPVPYGWCRNAPLKPVVWSLPLDYQLEPVVWLLSLGLSDRCHLKYQVIHTVCTHKSTNATTAASNARTTPKRSLLPYRKASWPLPEEPSKPTSPPCSSHVWTTPVFHHFSWEESLQNEDYAIYISDF